MKVKMLNRILKRTKADNGDAIMVLGIMLIAATLVIGGMLLDLSKAFQMKSSYNDAAQKATQAGIRYQNSEGYLMAESIAETLRVYETIARPSIINDGFMSFCATVEDPTRNIPITIRLVMEEFDPIQPTDFSITVNSNQINPADTVDTILARIGVNPAIIKNGKFKGLEMTLTESTPNVILPSAAKIGGVPEADVSPRCQTLGIRAGASKYTGKENQHN